MSELPRRTFQELLTRYEYEPTLNDIYVEGMFDKDVLDKCLASRDGATTVYTIDTVEVPPEKVQEYGLTSGNKQRLIALARGIAIEAPTARCVCLVDRDFDHWLGTMEVLPQLAWTRFASLEMYFYQEDVLYDIVVRTARANISNWPLFFRSFSEMLARLYVFRLADRELGWMMSWIPLERCATILNGTCQLDDAEFVSRLLQKNGKAGKARSFEAACAKWQSNTSGDVRQRIRGHDFVELLAWVIRKCKGIADLATAVAIERIFVLLAERASEVLDVIAPRAPQSSL